MLHSWESWPVIHVIYVNGHPVNIRRKCGGTVAEAAVALVESMLPQNAVSFQECNHTIAEVRKENQ